MYTSPGPSPSLALALPGTGRHAGRDTELAAGYGRTAGGGDGLSIASDNKVNRATASVTETVSDQLRRRGEEEDMADRDTLIHLVAGG